MARGHPPPHCENTQVLREAITEDDEDDDRNFLHSVMKVSRMGRLVSSKALSPSPVPDPKTMGLRVRYRTLSHAYEDCLGVR